jgi:chromate transporter
VNRAADRPTTLALLRIWVQIGLQSFGGGASTQLLIRREFVDRRAWLSADQFGMLWNLCLFTPGINLVALTVLIGRQLGGIRGIAASLAGLLLPSAAVTCLLAAAYKAVQHSAAVHAALQGVIPATAGIMAMVAVAFTQPLARRAHAEGTRAVVLSAAVALGSAAALIVAGLPVALVLGMAAILGAGAFTAWRRPAAEYP